MMKKSLFLLFFLSVCAAALFFHAAVRICSAEEQVSVTAQTLAGDPAAAAGITVTERTALRSHLLWETRFDASEPAGAATDFSFHANELAFPIQQPTPVIEFLFNLNGGIGSSGDILDDPEEMHNGFPMLPAIELAKKTEPGQTSKGSFVLSDYYEYLPYALNFFFYGDFYLEDPEQQMLEYFRIKTPKDLVVDLELTKDALGQTVNINYSSSSIEGLYTLCTSSEDGFYFTFSLSGALDFSEVPGGFGIYYLPVALDEEEQLYSLLVDQLANIYPLDPAQCQVLDLQFLENQNALCIFTLEEGRCWMNLLSLEGHQLTQRLEIEGDYQDGIGYPTRVEEGFLLVCDTHETFTLLEETAGGGLRAALCGNLLLNIPAQDGEEEQSLFLLGYDSTLGYDGERLVIATLIEPYHSAGFYLSVFDQDGLAYAGNYLHSQDAVNDFGFTTSDRCLPTEDALCISFA